MNTTISSFNSQVNDLEKLQYIEFLYNELLLPCNFDIKKDKNNIISKVIYAPEQKVKNTNDLEILIDSQNKSIENMIKNIPNFRQYEDDYDNILDIEEKSEIPEAINTYFLSMRKLINKETIFDNLKSDELIKYQLENYILYKLYDKLFPSEISEEDLFIYKKCERLSFLKPENVVKKKEIISENLLNRAAKYISQIDDQLTPIDKIKCIQKGKNIIDNSISFCSGKTELGVDDAFQPWIYVLIKAKPKNIATNCQYCYLYLNNELMKGEMGSIFTVFFSVLTALKNLKYNDLFGVTEEQFGKDEFELLFQ